MQQKLWSVPLQIECFGPHAYDFLNVFVLYQYNLVFCGNFQAADGASRLCRLNIYAYVYVCLCCTLGCKFLLIQSSFFKCIWLKLEKYLANGINIWNVNKLIGNF